MMSEKPVTQDPNEAAFLGRLPELLKDHLGKHALFAHGEFVGTFDSLTSAYEEGVKRFGLEPFFIGHVVERPEPQQAPALQHGLIHVAM